jgi:glycosyltransferase involved in cell wall biosynthesis
MLGWALNEEESIASYVDRAGRFLAALTDDFEVIVLDDGSTDRTWAIAIQMQETRPWLRVYRNEGNRGSGYNTKRAISLAQKDYVFWQTVDWAYDIEGLRTGLWMLQECDVLQGVRQGTLSMKGLVLQRSDNPYKGLVSVVNYLLIRVLFRLPLRDYQNVTVYPRSLIQSVSLESESAFTNPECLLKTWWKGATFREIEIPFVKRVRGQSKGTKPAAIVAAVADILRWWFRWIVLGRREHHGRGRVLRDHV